MSHKEPDVNGDICQQARNIHGPSGQELRSILVKTLFEQLHGSWNLNRRLQSSNASEPAGDCVGTATFTAREPSVFVNKDGKLETASLEMVYHELGYFEMQSAEFQGTGQTFPFSRRYVWRLQSADDKQAPTLSIWFTKPGTDKIDYIFHRLTMTLQEVGDTVKPTLVLEGDGGHLCEEDIYSSTYTFAFLDGAEIVQRGETQARLGSWKMLHEVLGPQKDQLIETLFTRE